MAGHFPKLESRVKNFRDLKVWQRSHSLTLNVYKATANFPSDERFGLTTQLRRASASIPANIAEGCGRSGDAEFGRFLLIAMGSASEVEYHCLLAKDLGMLSSSVHSGLDKDVKRSNACLR